MYSMPGFCARFSVLVPLALLAAPTFGCAAPKPEPEVASSATQPGYAQDYPATLEQIQKDFTRDDDDSATLSLVFAGYSKDIKTANWKVVADIHRRADESGRSQAFIERNEEVEGTRAFFAAEQDELVKKVGGSATFSCKQKGGDGELALIVSRTLFDAVKKQLEKRLRERNAAHEIIGRYRSELSKDDVAKLEAQADQISRASYLVHIAMVEKKVRLRELILEAEQVKKTLDDYMAAEEARKSKASKDADKIESDARIDRAKQAKGKIDGALTPARELEKTIEERITAAQKRHKEALDALLAEEDKKAGSS